MESSSFSPRVRTNRLWRSVENYQRQPERGGAAIGRNLTKRLQQAPQVRNVGIIFLIGKYFPLLRPKATGQFFSF
jgi:hypothetical protein